MKKRGIFLASLRHDTRVAFSNPWLKRRAYIFSLLQTHDRHSVFWSLFARRFFFVGVIFTLVHIFLSFSFLLLLRSISTVSIILAFLSYFSTFSNLPSISLSDGIDCAMCAHIFLSSSLIKKKKKMKRAGSGHVLYEHPYLPVAISRQGRVRHVSQKSLYCRLPSSNFTLSSNPSASPLCRDDDHFLFASCIAGIQLRLRLALECP